jgi:hypothetical protein
LLHVLDGQISADPGVRLAVTLRTETLNLKFEKPPGPKKPMNFPHVTLDDFRCRDMLKHDE